MARRWGLLTGIDIGADGDPYLDRLRLVETPWFSVFLHHIHRADVERDPHDHPWAFASLVLCGGYREQVWPDKRQACAGLGGYIVRVRRRGSLRFLGRDAAHIIKEVTGPLWTLVVTGPDTDDEWGFYVNGRYVGWRDYVGPSKAAEFEERKAQGRRT